MQQQLHDQVAYNAVGIAARVGDLEKHRGNSRRQGKKGRTNEAWRIDVPPFSRSYSELDSIMARNGYCCMT